MSCTTDYISEHNNYIGKKSERRHSGNQVGLQAYKFSVAGILFEQKTYHWQIKNELDTSPCMHIKACQRSVTGQQKYR